MQLRIAINPSLILSRAAIFRAKSSLLVWLDETKRKGQPAFSAGALAVSLTALVVRGTSWPKSLIRIGQAFKYASIP